MDLGMPGVSQDRVIENNNNMQAGDQEVKMDKDGFGTGDDYSFGRGNRTGSFVLE
jgi:hypothetical protein